MCISSLSSMTKYLEQLLYLFSPTLTWVSSVWNRIGYWCHLTHITTWKTRNKDNIMISLFRTAYRYPPVHFGQPVVPTFSASLVLSETLWVPHYIYSIKIIHQATYFLTHRTSSWALRLPHVTYIHAVPCRVDLTLFLLSQTIPIAQ